MAGIGDKVINKKDKCLSPPGFTIQQERQVVSVMRVEKESAKLEPEVGAGAGAGAAV